MRFVRIFFTTHDLTVVGAAEQEEPFTDDPVAAGWMDSTSLGVATNKLDTQSLPLVEWVKENVVIERDGVRVLARLRIASPHLLEQKTTAASILGNAPLDPRVASHLRERWAGRSDLGARDFKRLGMSLSEIRALPRFAAARAAAQKKLEIFCAERAVTNQKAVREAHRLARIDRKRKSGGQ